MPIAHAVIEWTDEEGQLHRVKRGEVIDVAFVPGAKELEKSGAIAPESYDSTVEAPQAPDELVIDGITYVKATDTGKTGGHAQR